MLTVDKKQGMARDHGELWESDADTGVDVIVDLSIEDDEQFCIGYSVGDKHTNIMFPIERLKALLKG